MSNDPTIQTTSIGHNVLATDNATVTIGSFVITSLSSNDLVTFIKLLFYAMTHRDWQTAEAYLRSINSVTSLDDECKSLLILLNYKLDLLQGKERIVHQNLFIELLRSPNCKVVIKDAVESIYIQYLSLSSKSNARERYCSSIYKGSFCDEVFYEVVADKEELAAFIIDGTTEKLEYELCAAVRCAIRNEDFHLAVELASELGSRYSNTNSTILLSLSKAYKLHRNFKGRHFWLVNRDLMEELEELISECVDFANKCDDQRILRVAAVLLVITWFQASDLIDLCSKNIEEVERVIPNARDLPPFKIGNHEALGFAKKILREGELTISEIEFSQVTSALMQGSISNYDIKRWVDKGGDVSVSNDGVKEFVQLILSAINCNTDDPGQRTRLSQRLETFLKVNPDILKDLHIQPIHQLCLNLKRVGLFLYVVKLTEPLLPELPWCSPIVDDYAEALLYP